MVLPYGSDLATTQTVRWAQLSATAVVLMAISESIAWSYVGYFLGPPSFHYLSGFVVGIVIFLAVSILDTSFVTLDLRRYEYQGLGEAPDKWVAFSRAVQGVWGGVLFRIFLVAGSLLVAAPYVSQLFLNRDVAHVLAQAHEVEIEAKRAVVRAPFQTAIAASSRLRDSLRRESIREAAGQGLSGRLGRGPTVATLEKQISQLDNQILALQQRDSAVLAQFNSLTPEQLQGQFGIQPPATGIQARNAAMAVVRQQPEFARTEWTIRAYLIGLFLLLIALKFYQPSTAGVYYSEYCQDTYSRYRRGEFDEFLPAMEKVSNGGDMPPLRFDEWVRTDYRKHVTQLNNSRVVGEIRDREKQQVDTIADVRSEARAELAPVLDDLQDTQGELTAAETRIVTLEAELQSTNAEIAQHELAISNLTEAMAYPRVVGAPASFVSALDTRASWEKGLASLHHRTRELGVELRKARDEKVSAENELRRIQAVIDSKSQLFATADLEIDKARKRAILDVQKRIV